MGWKRRIAIKARNSTDPASAKRYAIETSTGTAPSWFLMAIQVVPQIRTVSRGSGDVQKRLAYAYIDRACSPEIQERYAAELYLRPTNKTAVIPENLANKGVTNDAAGVAGLWTPHWDWYLENEQDIVETVNMIFGLT